MIPLTEKTVRASFVNASRKEATDLTLPPGFADLDWADLEYLGWRDPKLARRAYVVVPTLDADGRPGPAVAGVVLRQAEASPDRKSVV